MQRRKKLHLVSLHGSLRQRELTKSRLQVNQTEKQLLLQKQLK